MNSYDMINMAIRNLWKRKLRTFLTVLGVLIGTTSIVVMISIGIGMNESYKSYVEEMGSLTVIDVNIPWQHDENLDAKAKNAKLDYFDISTDYLLGRSDDPTRH